MTEDVIPEESAKAKGMTKGVIPSGQGMTRLNPANMKPYTAMKDYPERVLTEYERKWGWFEPHYEPAPRGYVVGDVLDLQHAPDLMIARLYSMKA
jgi:hypothetical protein